MAFGRFANRAKGLDRGRGVHGAKWVFVTGRDEMIDYATMRAQQPTDKTWKAFLLNHPDWQLFKSRKEARRWLGLRLGVRAGQIRNLCRQVRLGLLVRDPTGLSHQIGVYVADFQYEELANDGSWRAVTEDAKGYEEDLFKWKRRHVEAQLGITMRVT